MQRHKRLAAVVLLILPVVFFSRTVSASGFWSGQDNQAATASGRWPSLNEIEASAYMVYDSTTGQILLGQAADTALFPASTTKIMTAVLALEAMDLNQVITISETAVKLPSGSSKAGFLAGEKVAVRDVLAGLMLASGNDAANALAEAYAGSQEAFAAAMNKKAAELGMNSSHFCNPSGLHDDAHVTTVRDMAILAAYAMKNPQFRDLVSTTSYSMPATNLHPYIGWGMFINTNRFLQFGGTALQSDLLAEYTGIKTGSTNAAGNNLVAAAETQSGHELIAVIFGVPLTSKTGNTFIYARTLLEAAAGKIDATPTPALTSTIAETTTTPETSTGKPTASASSAMSTSENTPVPTGTQKPDAVPQGNLWRTACLILLPITLLLGLLLILTRRRKRRTIHPRRITPGRRP